MKETYENMCILLQCIKYEDHKRNICADLKLTELQSGCTKYCYFLGEWDSRARNQNYIVKEWQLRENVVRKMLNS